MSKKRWFPNGAGTRFALAVMVVVPFVIVATRLDAVEVLERAAFLVLGFFFGAKTTGGTNGADRLPDTTKQVE